MIPLAAGSLLAQPAQSFEVASIKRSQEDRPGRISVRGGPGSPDPTLATLQNIDLFSLTAMAYGVSRHQLYGPEWLSAERFDIVARIPAGATREQYRGMLQNLLAERFRLALHQEKKELTIYDLTVGRSGLKVKEVSADPAQSDDGSLQPPPLGGRPPAGYSGPAAFSLMRGSMGQLAVLLGGQLGQPVMDATGLTGRYEIKLHFTTGGLKADTPTDTEPTIFQAVQEQLGLRLVQRKSMVDVLVVDHIERTPIEN